MQVLSCATCLIRKYECMHAHLIGQSAANHLLSGWAQLHSSLLFLIPALKLFSEFDSKASLLSTEVSRKSHQAD